MIDQRNRERMKQALVQPYGPPRPDLERFVLGSVGRLPDRRGPSRILALTLGALLVVLAIAIVFGREIHWPLSQNMGTQEQNPVLQQLRHRPLNLPAMAADGSCPQSAVVTRDVFFKPGEHGSGWPVVGDAGPINAQPLFTLLAKGGYFFSLTYVADASYQGPALIRGRKLDG